MPGSALQYRIVVWVLRLGLPLLLVLGGVVYAAHRGAERLMEPLHWYGEVVVNEISFDLSGKVHAKDIAYRPFGAPEGATLTARGVDIATPGLRWLVSAGIAGNQASPAQKRRTAAQKARHGSLEPEPRALPQIGSVHATVEALEFGDTAWLPADLGWVGSSTGSPYAALGCGAMRRFDAETFEAMGVPSGPLKGEFRLDASADRATVEVRVFAEGRSSTAWSADVRLKEPGRFFDTDWQDMALAAEQWFVTDESFVVARNRYCARLAHLTRQGYVDHHANVIAQELARHGVSVPDELMDAFKRFDARGGELSWNSRPRSPLNRAEFVALPLEQQVQKLEAQVTVNGENPQPFRLDRITTEEEARIAATSAAEGSAAPGGASAPASAESGPTPKPPSTPGSTPPAATAASPPAAQKSGPPAAATAAATQATPAPSPTTPARAAAPPPPAAPPKAAQTVAKANAKPLPSYGRVRFDDLERAVGRTVAVETRFGTRRVGKITAFNRAAVTIDINEKGTSLPLTVPRGTVLSIELVSPESG